MFRPRRAVLHFPMSQRKRPRSSSGCWTLERFSSEKRILISLRPGWSGLARPMALATRFSIRIIFPEGRVRVRRSRVLLDLSRFHWELILPGPAGYRRHSITLLGSNRHAGCSALSVLCRLVDHLIA